ncbi:MAG: hypothetical protein GWP08_18790 [Nitrospiraceae bacterium]|nr:hypothetical protein [Nitrospiraceae bacterium]
MRKITVQVQDDHLGVLSRAKPITAIGELIWNALDAEASEVRVDFEENQLGGEETVRVRDNGHGLDYDYALVVFQNLGGSWKREGERTGQLRRALHGRYGKGRFRAFSLGNHVEWATTFRSNGCCRHYRIQGKAATLGEFELSDPEIASGGTEALTGLTVKIADLASNIGQLRGLKALQEITDIFAPYLRQYPGVGIVYDGIPLDPANAEEHRADYDLGELVLPGGDRIQAALTIVEWTMPGKRGLMLCDENGFALHTVRPKLHVRGFSYTAYVKSAHISAMENEGLLQLEGMAPDVAVLLDAARTAVRKHFAQREIDRGHDIVDQWQELGIYPYTAPPANVDEARERQIFNIYATHLGQHAALAKSSFANKRLMLRLIQELVHAKPTGVARILDDLVSFPAEKEQQVLGLLEE